MGEMPATPLVLETSFSRAVRRGSLARGSLWEELEEPPDAEPEELDDLASLLGKKNLLRF
jgi:hypothetical protein